MRILITTGIYPPDIGGPARYVPVIGRALAEAGHDVVVVTLADDVGATDSKTDDPVDVVRMPRRLPLVARTLLTGVRVSRLAHDCDLLFVNGLPVESRVPAWLSDTPYVVKVVGDWAWERAVQRGWTTVSLEAFQHATGIRVSVLRWLRNSLLRGAERVIVPSRYLQELVESWGVTRGRIRVIHNGVPPSSPDEGGFRDTGSALRVISLSRLVSWKRVDGIIRAVSELPGTSLTIVGDGPLKPDLERLALQLELHGRVTFAGAVQRDQVQEHLRQADVLVLNSTYEGLPHAVIEAYAAGVPVIATSAGGTAEVVRCGGGRLVDSHAELVEALSQLRDDHDIRAQLSRDAKRVVATNFSEKAMIDRTLDTLETAARTDA